MLSRCWLQFEAQEGAMLTRRSTRNGPRASQEPSGSCLGIVWDCSCSQEPPKSCQELLQTLIKKDFWRIIDRFASVLLRSMSEVLVNWHGKQVLLIKPWARWSPWTHTEPRWGPYGAHVALRLKANALIQRTAQHFQLNIM